MELKVKRYNATEDYHECVDAIGRLYRLDLVTDGGFRGVDDARNYLVGKTVWVESISPYISIATDVRVVDDTYEARKD